MIPHAYTWSGTPGKHSTGAVCVPGWQINQWPNVPEDTVRHLAAVPADRLAVLILVLKDRDFTDPANLKARIDAILLAVKAGGRCDLIALDIEVQGDLYATVQATVIESIDRILPGVQYGNYADLSSDRNKLPAPCLYGWHPVGETDQLKRLAWSIEQIKNDSDIVWLGTTVDVGESIDFRPYLSSLDLHTIARKGGQRVILFDPIGPADQPDDAYHTASPVARDRWDASVDYQITATGGAEWSEHVGTRLLLNKDKSPYALETLWLDTKGVQWATVTQRIGRASISSKAAKYALPELPQTRIVKVG